MSDTLILSRKHVAKLLTIDECMQSVEAAFRNVAEGEADPPKVLGIRTPNGGLHIQPGVHFKTLLPIQWFMKERWQRT